MNYEFPVINNISQVLPLIADRKEFVVADRPEFGITVINYVVMMDTTFPRVTSNDEAILRELRGIKFNTKTGNIICRPLQKFFNIGEKEETQLQELDFSQPHTVYTKVDGSMIVPFMTDDGIRFGTKMGITDVGLQAEKVVKENPNIMEFSKWCIENQISPIFEFTAPDNQIVIAYSKAELTLLAARHMITGEYLQL